MFCSQINICSLFSMGFLKCHYVLESGLCVCVCECDMFKCGFILLILFQRFISLFKRHSYSERKRDRDRERRCGREILRAGLLPKWPKTWAGLSWARQEPGISSRVGPSAASPGISAWNWIRGGIPRTQTGTHLACHSFRLKQLCHRTSPNKRL